ncbi:hypothetical protein GCM10018790_75310 [Kitasatospora xanthocidica]|uniref:helix-turn-helix domain-containing protein n=1 Tax=Kitasatospora xanthocidica TaxID=83382 RepID=UPI00167238AE|nr:helix-turn-helix domain-containing protein [Kitasatospora xanthocidica]GHF86767.1 hypothetical protein GCM10018790_75310 [Kitasatospora xanthocidica]
MFVPEPLPAGVLADPMFVAACAARQIGPVFQAVRKTGVGAAEIARRTGLTTSRVTEIMSGGRVVESMAVIERIADGLRIPGRMLGLADRQWEGLTVATGYEPAAVPEAWEILDMLMHSTASDAALRRLEHVVADTAFRYPSTPPAESRQVLRRQLAGVHAMLARPQAVDARRRGVRILAVVSGLLGLANHDLGHRVEADGFFDVGTAAATEGEADDLAAWVLTMHSIAEYTAGRSTAAADLLRKAVVRAEAAPVRRLAWVTANLARTLAACGDQEPARAALEQATKLLDSADEPVHGLDFFTAPRLEGIAGETCAHLGEYDDAAALLVTAIGRRDAADIKGRSVLALDLAEVRLQQGDVHEACAIARDALDLASATVVKPLVVRAQGLRRSLAPWAHERPVLELTARVKELEALLVRV